MELKKIRQEQGLTQQAVADGIGCSANVYSRYEREEREPSIEVILSLADFFGVTLDYLFGRDSSSISSLSSYENQLVIASRGADDRAKEDALDTLLKHQMEKGLIKRA